MHRVPAHRIVIDPCRVDVLAVKFARKKWVRQLSEELLQQARDTIHVVLEGFWIPEINLGRICSLLA